MTDQRKKTDGKFRKPEKRRSGSKAARDRAFKIVETGVIDDSALLEEISVQIDSLTEPEEGPSAKPPETEAASASSQKRSTFGTSPPVAVNPSRAKAARAPTRKTDPPAKKEPAGGAARSSTVTARQKLEEARRRSAAAARKARQRRAGKRTAIFLVIAGLVALLGAVGGLSLFKPQPRPEPPKPVKFTVQNVPEFKIETPASEPGKVIVPAGPAPSSAEPDRADAPPESPAEKAIPSSTAAVGTAARGNPEAEIKAFLASWGKAWEASAGQNGRIDPYIAHFSEEFRDGSMDLAAWRADKAAKNRRKEWIRIGIGSVRVFGPAADGTVRVTFLQTYESSNYSDKTEKTLVLSREDGRWKISSFGGPPTPR